MELLDMSIIRLAWQINVDTSHISRFRSGVRPPKPNTAVSELLSEVLLKRAGEQNRLFELSKLTSLPTELLSDEEECASAFSELLYDSGETDTSDIDRLFHESTAYHFYVLTELPFSDIQIIKSGDRVTVIRARQPYAADVEKRY